MQLQRRLYVAIHLGLTAALALIGGITYAGDIIANPKIRAQADAPALDALPVFWTA